MSGEPIYTASVGPDDTGGMLTLGVRRAIPAGIDGPISRWVNVIGATVPADLDRELRDLGYQRTGEWELVKAYDGMRLHAPVARGVIAPPPPVREPWEVLGHPKPPRPDDR